MVGTLDEALDMKRRPQKDELTDIDREHIGTFVRLEIPLTDIYKLRKVADILRGIADRIDHTTRRDDRSIKDILLRLKYELQTTGHRIRCMYPEVFKRRFYSHGPQDYCDTTDSADTDT
jgi:hypothetical protein